MSHFTVMVIGSNPEKQLMPYDEGIQMPPYDTGEISEDDKTRMVEYYAEKYPHEKPTFDECCAKYGEDWDGGTLTKHTDGTWHEYSTYNPNSKWDWYSLGGRWSNFLLLKNGLKADAALKKDIDFDEMERLAADKAGQEWDKVHKAIDKHQKAYAWEFVRDEMCKGDVDTARKVYHEQPQVKAFAKVKDGFYDSLEDYQMSREDYVINAAIGAYSTFAAVKDGKWFEKGSMGWFGMSTDKMTQDEWNKQLRQMIKELPEDTLISIYDCHI